MRFRRRLGVVALILLLGSSVAACGLDAPDAGVVEAGPEARLRDLNALDMRVAVVAWQLARANADLCPVTRPSLGWTLHSASQYGAELRPLARQRHGLDGDLPGILAAPADSPAALAGLQPGDLIVSVNGLALERGEESAAAYEGLQANSAVLDRAATLGPLQLQVRREGVERSVRLRPIQACAYATQVEVTGKLRAHADGRTIFISDGMANLAGTDAELAFVLAHELGHAVLEHRTDDSVTGVRGASNWAISMRRGLSLGSEADADRMGLFLMARAGFDPDAALTFLTAYEQVDAGADYAQINTGGVYRSSPDRRRALQPVLADIASRRAAGRVLIP